MFFDEIVREYSNKDEVPRKFFREWYEAALLDRNWPPSAVQHFENDSKISLSGQLILPLYPIPDSKGLNLK